MLVKDIMTAQVITVSTDFGVHELADLLIENDISGAPVVDEQGNYLGLVTEESVIFKDKKLHLPTVLHLLTGFLAFGVSRTEEEIKKISGSAVADIMDKDAVTVGPRTPVEEVATMITEKKIHYFPVVEGGRLLGVVTRRDVLRVFAG